MHLITSAFAALVICLSSTRLVAQAPATQPVGPGAQGIPDLVAGLKATPGCLGVQVGRVNDGKTAAIFAFFENKKAALSWYYSPMHQQVVRMIDKDNDRSPKPMEEVPDDVPVMAVASITIGGKPAVEGSPIPFSQIAIELYTPLTGGLELGGGFSPDSFRARHASPTTKPSGG
ncbi:MAG: hypothetical protein ACREJC_22025 [Tepidisphaeraceae bacterium]